MGVIVSGIVMAVLIEPTAALRMTLSFAPSGLALGYGFRRGWSAVRIFVVALVAAILAKAAAIALILIVTGINPITAQADILQQSFDISAGLYTTLGVAQGDIDAAQQQFSKAMAMVSLLLPLIVVIMGVLDAGVNYFIAGRVLRRLGHPVPFLPAFSEWRMPQAFVLLFGFSLVGMYWGGTREVPWLSQLSLNMDMLATFAGLLQGISLLWYVFGRLRFNRALSIIIIVFIMLNGILAQIVAFTGLFDMVFDYRRRFGQRQK
jgi:uncharacterized protein YybS (DUF2232 family)